MRGIKSRGIERWKRLGVFIFLLLILLILLNSVRKVYNKKQNAEEALARMQTDVTKLEGREQDLKASESRIESSEGLEFELRKKFSVARPGESVAIVVESEDASSTLSLTDSLWQRFKNFFTDLFE